MPLLIPVPSELFIEERLGAKDSKAKFSALVLSRLSVELHWDLMSFDQEVDRFTSFCKYASWVDSVLLWAVTEIIGFVAIRGGIGGAFL